MFVNSLPLFASAQAEASVSNPSFTTTSNSNRITIESPVYDNSTQLYMRIATGLLTPSSNPYINISYINKTTNAEEFSSSYIFRQIIEYSQTNGTVLGPHSNTIDQVVNIGTNNTFSTNLNAKGYQIFNSSISTFQNQIVHTISIKTLNGMFSFVITIPEGTIVPNGVQVDVPGIFITSNITNFPFIQQNSLLALNMLIVTSQRNSVTIVSSNEIDINRDYSSDLRSVFYAQNGTLSDLQSSSLFVRRFIKSNLVLVTNHNSISSFNLYIGQITPQPFYANLTLSSSGISPNTGILDYPINLGFMNLEITVGNLAYISLVVASFLTLLGFIYYILKKYLLYILGLLLAISVSLYLPTRKVTAIQALHHDKRREIMDTLHEAAGSGMVMRDLKDKVNLPQTTLLWHLQILEEFEFITRVKIHKQVVIVSNDFLEQFDPRIKELELSFLSEQGEKFREFVSSKELNEPFSLIQVINKTGWHEKTAKKHINRMNKLGIVIPINKPNFYVIAPEFHNYFHKK